jgi:hypothetical protein
MGKFIQKVADLVKVALQKGSAKNKPYEARYNKGTLVLIHYSTIILLVNREGAIKMSGSSQSDRNAIETALIVFQGRKNYNIVKPKHECDNVDCTTPHLKTRKVKMDDEFGGGYFYWCDNCIERDEDMLDGNA